MIEVVDGATDDAAVARIYSDVMRWSTTTPERVHYFRGAMPTLRDWLARVDGEAVGAARCVELPDMKESEAASADICVLPAARQRGVGTLLFEHTSTHARSLGKTELEVFAYEDDADGVAFAERRGFRCIMRMRSLRLVLEGLEAPSIELPDAVSLTTLAERPDLGHQMWEVACEAIPDIPIDSDVPMHPGTFEEFHSLHLAGPRLISDATFLALHGDDVIGYGQLEWQDRAGGIAVHEMLAVRRAFRGRGVAGAIKAAQISWALETGLKELRTGNEERNVAARAVNARYPYQPTPDGLLFRGPIASDTHDAE